MTKAISPFKKEVYERNSQIYKLMANPKRLEILNILKKSGETTVDELSEVIGIRKANTSQHLSVLRYLKLVKVRKNGKYSHYSITDPRIVEPCSILKALWEGKLQ